MSSQATKESGAPLKKTLTKQSKLHTTRLRQLRRVLQRLREERRAMAAELISTRNQLINAKDEVDSLKIKLQKINSAISETNKLVHEGMGSLNLIHRKLQEAKGGPIKDSSILPPKADILVNRGPVKLKAQVKPTVYQGFQLMRPRIALQRLQPHVLERLLNADSEAVTASSAVQASTPHTLNLQGETSLPAAPANVPDGAAQSEPSTRTAQTNPPRRSSRTAHRRM